MMTIDVAVVGVKMNDGGGDDGDEKETRGGNRLRERDRPKHQVGMYIEVDIVWTVCICV